MAKKILFVILTSLLLPYPLGNCAQNKTTTQSDSQPIQMSNTVLRDVMESKSTPAKQVKSNEKQPSATTLSEADIEKEIEAAKQAVKKSEKVPDKNDDKNVKPVPAQKPSCPPVSQPITVNWTSKNANDVLTISNGSSIKSYLVIVVNGSGSSPGIVLINCGKIKRVSAGNSAICDTGDPTSPVSFSSDSKTAASGTYAIKTATQ